jgi:DNA-binding GntR family transcriptional regulator
LRESILSGVILPGARITEVQLAEETGLSRATIRAALHQLEKEGLTTLIPYTGWTVISLSSSDVWELYTLRSSFERLAARLIANNLDNVKTDTITRGFEVLADACERNDVNAIADADFALHKKLIELSGHGRMLMQYEVIERQIRLFIMSSDSLIQDSQEILNQHRPIIEAILSGNAEEAGRLSEHHNLSEGQKLNEHLNLIATSAHEEPPSGRLKNLKPRRKSVA